jgi:hypothetical protein
MDSKIVANANELLIKSKAVEDIKSAKVVLKGKSSITAEKKKCEKRSNADSNINNDDGENTRSKRAKTTPDPKSPISSLVTYSQRKNGSDASNTAVVENHSASKSLNDDWYKVDVLKNLISVSSSQSPSPVNSKRIISRGANGNQGSFKRFRNSLAEFGEGMSPIQRANNSNITATPQFGPADRIELSGELLVNASQSSPAW